MDSDQFIPIISKIKFTIYNTSPPVERV